MHGFLSPYLKRQRLNRIGRCIPAGSCILDIGCDDGALLGFIPPFARYLGIDADAAVIGRNRRSWSLANASFEAADILSFSPPPPPFDIVAMAAVIEHLADHRAVLERLRIFTTADARLLITTPAPLGDPVLKVGAIFGIFDRHGLQEHRRTFCRADFAAIPGWALERYRRFEWGLNQLIVLRKDTRKEGGKRT